MKKQNNGLVRNPFLYLLIIFFLVTGFQYFYSGNTAGRSEKINYTELVKEITADNVKELTYQPNGSIIEVSGVYKNPKTSKEETGIQFFTPTATTVERFSSTILPSDSTVSELQKLASEHQAEVTVKHESSSGMWINILVSVVPFAILFFFLFSMMGNMGGNSGRNPMSFGRSKAKAANKEDIKVRFSDVAGAEEEKQELVEVVDLKLVAQQTPGFVGADLENVLNEAALVAARRNKSIIDASDIDEAEDRVIAGPSKKDKTVSQRERELVAYHEAGHTIVGLVLSNARVVHKVTIVPRGRAGGYMIALPKEDQMLLSKEDMKEQLAGLMGGRVAEEIIFNVQTTGASNDFEQATQMARAMVTEYGMSEKLGPVQYEGNHAMFGAQSPQKSISEQTAYEIDEEVRSLLNEARNKAAEIIQSNRETHKLIAEALLKYETLDSTQIKSLYETGKMPETVEEESHALSYDEVKSKMSEEE